MEAVSETGIPLVITKISKPVAQLGPVIVRASTLAGAHAGKIQILGDIIAPIDVDWEATR